MLQTQQHKFVNWQCDTEYRGDDFTAAVTLGNPDVLVGSGIVPCISSNSSSFQLDMLFIDCYHVWSVRYPSSTLPPVLDSIFGVGG